MRSTTPHAVALLSARGCTWGPDGTPCTEDRSGGRGCCCVSAPIGEEQVCSSFARGLGNARLVGVVRQ
jgi:hypothetical protein